MAESEVDVISHLLKIESEASDLVKDAKIEADKRVSVARAKADEDYKKQMLSINAELDKVFNLKMDAVRQNHKKQIDDYINSLESVKKDVDSFNSFLDKALQF